MQSFPSALPGGRDQVGAGGRTWPVGLGGLSSGPRGGGGEQAFPARSTHEAQGPRPILRPHASFWEGGGLFVTRPVGPEMRVRELEASWGRAGAVLGPTEPHQVRHSPPPPVPWATLGSGEPETQPPWGPGLLQSLPKGPRGLGPPPRRALPPPAQGPHWKAWATHSTRARVPPTESVAHSPPCPPQPPDGPSPKSQPSASDKEPGAHSQNALSGQGPAEGRPGFQPARLHMRVVPWAARASAGSAGGVAQRDGAWKPPTRSSSRSQLLALWQQGQQAICGETTPADKLPLDVVSR